MFCVTQSPTFIWPVKFEMPSADKPGAFDQHTFDGVFKRLTEDTAKELMAKAEEAAREESAGEPDGQKAKAFIRLVLVDWKGVTDADGKEVPFTYTTLDQVTAYPQARWGIMHAFREAHTNQAARRKN